MPERISLKVKKEVEQRAWRCCEYCMAQVRYSQDSFTVEHIFPSVKGGSNSPDNLAYSCQGCNNHKYIFTESIDPSTGLMVPLFNPRINSWNEHFLWNGDFTQIIGLTTTGRATVERLQLNREGLVNLREVLIQAGKHPPLHLTGQQLPHP